MKLPDSWTWAELRHRFVLTPEEKRVIGFVIVAFLLGAGTKCYRETRPQSLIRIEKEHPASHHSRDRAFVRPD